MQEFWVSSSAINNASLLVCETLSKYPEEGEGPPEAIDTQTDLKLSLLF